MMGEEKGTKAGTEGDNRRIKKKKESWHGATDWNIRGQEEATQQRGPLDWIIHIRGDALACGQAHSSRTGTSGDERTGRQQGHPGWIIWGKEEDTQQRGPLDGNIRGKQRQGDKHKEPGLEHPGETVPAGNRASRTGSSGGQKPGTGSTGDEESGPRKGSQGQRKEEEAAAARKTGGQSRGT